tara:strand:- start:300 stop:665 length:366 start_codon:yes stop_codon:yes gene_type:complete
MQNMSYEISEKERTTQPIDIETFVAEITSMSDVETKTGADVVYAVQLDYSTNYTVKQLGNILDYYEISRRKMRKEEMVEMIVLYENEEDNMMQVEQRKRLWKNFEELKQDKYFSKFLIIDL